MASRKYMNNYDTSGNSGSKPELLEAILEPLLDDFRYWFDRSQQLFETERMSFMSEVDQANLVIRIKDAQQAVSATTMLFKATGKQVGVEIAAIAPWHHLLMECQAVAMRFRQTTADRNPE